MATSEDPSKRDTITGSNILPTAEQWQKLCEQEGLSKTEYWRKRYKESNLPFPTIKVTKLQQDAQLPANAHEGDAGYDLVAIDDGEVVKDKDGNILYIQYKTGIAIEPPEDFHTEIFPRSSITKTHLVLANSIGLIDTGYRGEIMVRFKAVKLSEADLYSDGDGSTHRKHKYGEIIKYNKGDKIAQLVIRPTINMDFAWVEKLEETERGVGGFGSTDKK